MIELGGHSVGFQIDGFATDVVMLMHESRRGIDSLLEGNLALGVRPRSPADIMAEKPLPKTDAAMKAKILQLLAEPGRLCGDGLKGVTLHQDESTKPCTGSR